MGYVLITEINQTNGMDTAHMGTDTRDYHADASYLLVVTNVEDANCNVGCNLVQNDGANNRGIVFSCKTVNDTNAVQFHVPNDGNYTLYAYCNLNTTYIQLYLWQ